MPVSFVDMVRVFGRIGLLSFGGPAAQIGLMHRELVEERPWLSEAQYLRALSFCMLLPGPEAMQLATYAGWRLRGIRGGLLAGGLFVIPGALVIFALATAYGSFGTLPIVQALFLGVKATVIVIVVQAILRLSKKALKRNELRIIALVSFLALFLFNVPFPLVVVLAGIWGAARAESRGTLAMPPNLSRSLPVLAIGGSLWAAPILLAAFLGADLLVAVGLFFSKLAVVTFGGAYAVLAYMTQEVVTDQGWISAGQMLDGLGLAETTPGPLILVTEFVGITAGINASGMGLGLLTGLMALWVTFVPCFIWIFAGAPLIDWLEHKPRLSAALTGITAAVVGVIANLSLWFAAHVLFADVAIASKGPLRLLAPVWSSFLPAALLLTLLAGTLLLWRKWPLWTVLMTTAFVAGAFYLLWPSFLPHRIPYA